MMSPVTLYKCLSDDTRLKCLLLLTREKELCICELVHALDLSQPKVSRHIARLRDDAMVTARRQGQWVFYQVNKALPSWVHGTLQSTLDNNTDYLFSATSALASMGSRPMRQAQCCA